MPSQFGTFKQTEAEQAELEFGWWNVCLEVVTVSLRFRTGISV